MFIELEKHLFRLAIKSDYFHRFLSALNLPGCLFKIAQKLALL